MGSREIKDDVNSFTKWKRASDCAFSRISLSETLLGGQSFVWTETQANRWTGVVGKTIVELRLREGNLDWRSLLGSQFSHDDLARYLWLDSSYEEALDQLPWRSDPVMACCIKSLKGLRILKQPLDETLFYFLLSPVKSIPQIREIGYSIARKYGPFLGRGNYGFPGWERLSEIPEQEFRNLKVGYRAKSIVGVARFLAKQPDWLTEVEGLEYGEARNRLVGLPGVGQKIADCVLLFGAGKFQAFPIDTWIEKTLERRYQLKGWTLNQKIIFACRHFGKHAGLAQQFLFSAERLGFLNEFE